MITYLKGDATAPHGPGPKVIAHICNNAGGWGSGFVLAVSRRWKRPEAHYRAWAAGKGATDLTPGEVIITPHLFRLGEIQTVQVEHDLYVANMVAQSGYGVSGRGHHKSPGDPPPIRYDALEACLTKLAADLKSLKASVHAPRIGCGLAGGTWDQVEPIILRALDGRPVFIYDLP